MGKKNHEKSIAPMTIANLTLNTLIAELGV